MPDQPNPTLENLGMKMQDPNFRKDLAKATTSDDKDTVIGRAGPLADIPSMILVALKTFKSQSELDYLARVGHAFWTVNQSTTVADGNADGTSGLKMV